MRRSPFILAPIDVGIVCIHGSLVDTGTVHVRRSPVDTRTVRIQGSYDNIRIVHVHRSMLTGVWIPQKSDGPVMPQWMP